MNYIIRQIVKWQLKKYKRGNKPNFYDWCCNSFNNGEEIFEEYETVADQKRRIKKEREEMLNNMTAKKINLYKELTKEIEFDSEFIYKGRFEDMKETFAAAEEAIRKYYNISETENLDYVITLQLGNETKEVYRGQELLATIKVISPYDSLKTELQITYTK